MAKIKLTKGELKKQRDALKQFKHYLPTLQLKKQQLQMKILEARKAFDQCMERFNAQKEKISQWAGLLGDPRVDLSPWITPQKILVDSANIAGANIPVFNSIDFKEAEYDFYLTPFWIDKGIEEMRLLNTLLVQAQVIQKQIAVLQKELRVTTQRVNLFEKVKIPECLENIRKIRINLGDQQANAVGISKVAKKKVEIRNLEEVLV